MQTFVTVLIPHGSKEAPAELAACVRMLETDRPGQAIGLSITKGGKTYQIGAKLDMEAELIRDWRRPMYTYESGRTRYGEFETDAYMLFAVESGTTVNYAMVGAAKISYRGNVLHEQLPVRGGLNFDGSPDLPATSKLRYWEGTHKR